MCATTICYADGYKKYSHISKIWFERYVQGYGEIYGILSTGSNVHLLTHIHDDPNAKNRTKPHHRDEFRHQCAFSRRAHSNDFFNESGENRSQ